MEHDSIELQLRKQKHRKQRYCDPIVGSKLRIICRKYGLISGFKKQTYRQKKHFYESDKKKHKNSSPINIIRVHESLINFNVKTCNQ